MAQLGLDFRRVTRFFLLEMALLPLEHLVAIYVRELRRRTCAMALPAECASGLYRFPLRHDRPRGACCVPTAAGHFATRPSLRAEGGADLRKNRRWDVCHVQCRRHGLSSGECRNRIVSVEVCHVDDSYRLRGHASGRPKCHFLLRTPLAKGQVRHKPILYHQQRLYEK
jgi:hypothetical protein